MNVTRVRVHVYSQSNRKEHKTQWERVHRMEKKVMERKEYRKMQ